MCGLRAPHALNNGRSPPISTVEPSIRACAIAPRENLEAGYQIAVVSHLLGKPPNEWPHQHTIESGRQWQASEEVRWRKCPVQKPTGRISAGNNEHEAHRDEREAEKYIELSEPMIKINRLRFLIRSQYDDPV